MKHSNRPLLSILSSAAIAFALASGSPVSAQDDRHPVYVGARACAACHQGPEMGHQFSKWLLSQHSRAYAVLAQENSRDIAELSGIPGEPQKAAVCLGCHATGMEAEEWERDETFRLEDGVQCERCHGAGSEYMDLETMRDPEAALSAGLKKMTKSECMVCHYEKGSHVAVHRKPALDIDDAWKRIAHPAPEAGEATPTASAQPLLPDRGDSARRYVGSQVCAQCHDGPDMGYQFSRWRLSRHAGSYARLATPEAYEMARRNWVRGNSQQSAECLKCHATGGSAGAFEASFSIDEGVGCEACHGPGSEYRYEAIMRDETAALRAGLVTGNREICAPCHEEAHGRDFVYESAWEEIRHPAGKVEFAARGPVYKTPLNMALSPDGRELYVACEAGDSLIVVDVASRRKIEEIAVGARPHDVTFSPDGSLVYVSNRLDDTISEIDPATRRILRTVAVGDEPHGLLTSRDGSRIFVLNTGEASISVLDARSLEEIRRLAASRYPWSMALSPDGAQLLVTNTLSRLVEFRTPSLSEVTVLNPLKGTVTNRLEAAGANLLQGISWHPGGQFALFTLNRTKNLVPMTRLNQGWTITNGVGIAWRDGRVDQVLLDEADLCFPDPTDVAFSPDGKRAFVTSSGSNRVAVIDVDRLLAVLEGADERERTEILPNHTGIPTDFVIRHLETKDSPRGIVVTDDGATVFVANALDDSLSVIDARRLVVEGRIDLGGPATITRARLGERLFHSADITFHRQFSCHTCHPDGHVDGITYDIEPDGVGVSPVDNRTLRGILDTAPFKWEGTNPSLQRQCGPRLAVFFTRIDPFTPEELAAVDTYISTIERPPNRYRAPGAPLTDAQRRGRLLFGRTRRNDGSPIPLEQRCDFCHPPPLYTNHSVVDVGTRFEYDREGRFDVPHLTNIYDSAPYLHNGIAHTLEEIWTVYNPEDRHGVTNDMTKDQLNDLIEYIRTF